MTLLLTKPKDQDLHPFFGRHNLTSAYDPDFEYMTVQEYQTIHDWIDYMFIHENENVSFKTEEANQVSFIDKRSGILYSTMYIMLPLEVITHIKQNPTFAQRVLINYYFLHNTATLNLKLTHE